MWPIGFLMREHRLIEKAINLMIKERKDLLKGKKLNPEFIRIICDFFKIYADKLHHGKEEDILFKGLKAKKISKEHSKVLDRLIKDHEFARAKIKELRKVQTEKRAAELMTLLINLYPEHIRIEDNEFFYPVMSYFSENERQAMHEESLNFDKKFIHKIYEESFKELK